ncbi:MAG: ATP-binding protein, partial [Myxococcota bacterium]
MDPTVARLPTAQEARRARLVSLAGGTLGEDYLVDGVALIGRSGECDIILAHAGVSRQHARLERDVDGRYVVEDLGSRNGTLLNGRPVKRHALRPGDRIQLGAGTVLLFTVEDIAEHAADETRRLQGVAWLAAGIAHDFKNVLGVVAQSLAHLEQVEEGPERGECLQDARQATEQAIALARRLVTVARPGRRERQPIVLDRFIADAVPLVRRLLPHQVRLEAQAAPGLLVYGHEDELHQVLMNLVLNARDAMPEGGTISLMGEYDATRRRARLTVSDDGVGMSAATQARIFEPFFTTKAGSGGTGLGLAMVYSLVKNGGGDLEVESRPSEGTTFRLYFPAGGEGLPAAKPTVGFRRPSLVQDSPHSGSPVRQSDDEPSVIQPVEPEPEPSLVVVPRKPSALPPEVTRARRIDRLRVLFVDDEPLLVKSTTRLLRAHAEVLACGLGAEALALAERDADFDLVLLDRRLPDAPGDELLEAFAAVLPGVP